MTRLFTVPSSTRDLEHGRLRRPQLRRASWHLNYLGSFSRRRFSCLSCERVKRHQSSVQRNFRSAYAPSSASTSSTQW